jgi:hypothetical protein
MPTERRKLKCRTTGGEAQVAIYATVRGAGRHAWTLIEEADLDLKLYERGDPDLAAEDTQLPGSFEDCMMMVVVIPPPGAGKRAPTTLAAVQQAIDEVLDHE